MNIKMEIIKLIPDLLTKSFVYWNSGDSAIAEFFSSAIKITGYLYNITGRNTVYQNFTGDLDPTAGCRGEVSDHMLFIIRDLKG